MRHVWGLLLILPGLGGCAWFREPPQQGITTGATVVYTGSPGSEIFSICDKGNLVYLTKSNPQVAIVKDGCLGGPGGPSPVAVVAATEPRTPPAAPPVTLPQPLLVQIVPGPGPAPVPPPAAAQLPAEPREHIIVVPPPACPVCPTLPEWTPPPAVPQTRAPKATPQPAPTPKVIIVPQVDPNTASTDDLERLPGITHKTAVAIARNRPYRTLNELVEKKVLSDADLKALAPYLAIR